MLYNKQAKFFSRLGRIVSGKGLQIKFKDRIGASNALSIMLKSFFKDISNNKNIVVIGIPRGGIVVANTIASKLFANFDIVISRKLRHIDNKEQAIGAVVEDGPTYS